MARNPIIVLKFGSSVLADEASLPAAVHEIYRWVRAGRRVVAVVSALGRTTDRLISHAGAFARSPDPSVLAGYVAIGEATSASLLGLALDRAGIESTVLDSGSLGLLTEGPPLDSRPVRLDTRSLLRALAERPVAVVPGFVGRDSNGHTTLLGRGGSDLTALFIAAELQADEARLIKDVDGLYDQDPAQAGGAANRYAQVSWNEVLGLSEGIVQHKAVRFARDRGLNFTVTSAGSESGTLVGDVRSAFAPSRTTLQTPLRVALLGFGTVGGGVYAALWREQQRFEIVGVAVRDQVRYLRDALPRTLATTDAAKLVDGPADVVVEAIGGTTTARHLVERALRHGKSVVTANKALIASHGVELAAIAEAHNARLLYSAAVGGAVPILEAARRVHESGGVRQVRAILNGTSNFVLDRVSEGVAFDDALRLAQALGFAEADPSDDVSGADAARKLVVIARSLGIAASVHEVSTRGIGDLNSSTLQHVREHGRSIRLVATLNLSNGRYSARVAPEELAAHDPLSATRDEQSRAVITGAGGDTEVVGGRGAGRWPTAEAVIADLFDLSRNRRGTTVGTRPGHSPAATAGATAAEVAA